MWNMSYAFAGSDRKIKNRCQIISNQLYFIKEGHSGERHGPEQWQYDHWKARDATKGLKKKGDDSIVHRWFTDPQFQESQWSHGWAEEYGQYLDYLPPSISSIIATGSKRSRYHNMLVLRFQDGKNPGKMSNRDDFKLAARSIAVISHQEGRENPFIPKSKRERQIPLNEKLRSELKWQS